MPAADPLPPASLRPLAASAASRRPGVARLALFVAGYLLAAGFAKWLALIPGTGISIWPPAGVYLAALLVASRASWPWWIAAALLAELTANAIWFRNPLHVALLLNAGNALCALAGALLIARACGPRFRLETLQSVLALVLLGALAAPLASAAVGASTLAWAEGQPWARAFGLWWVGDATGVLVVAPLVLVGLAGWREAGLSHRRLAEASLVVLVVAGAGALALGGLLPYAYLVMPAVLWAAVRFEFRGAVLSIALLAVMTAAYTVAGVSPFSGDAQEQPQRQVMLQLFLAVSALSALVVAAVARQYQLALLLLRQTNEDLERRVAERTNELSQSERRFRALADTVPVVIWVTDAEGRVEFVNREYERFFGISEAQVREGGWQPLLHPDDASAYVGAFTHALRERGEFAAETRVRRADGQWRVIASRATPRFSGSGEFQGMVGSSPDITERKQVERTLTEASREKDEFLAMLAHELRNPLAPIRNAAELLKRTQPRHPTVDNASAMIERQVTHLTRLVDDLLDVSRVSRGQINLQMAPVDLCGVVQQAVQTQQPWIDARRHRVQLVLPEAPVWVHGDATRLAQMVGNLVNNAAKYTDAGGRIEVRVEGAAGDGGVQPEALVRVRDDGHGIEPEALERLFQLFYQVPGTLDRAQGGLGIGLALVRRLAQMHGGTVQAASEGRGRGSEFVLRLPLLTAPPADAARTADEPPAPVPRRVLVVDDNHDAAQSTALLLRADGHEVQLAYDGEQAVQVARETRPAAVLLDLGLPRLDGYAACRAMREAGLTDVLIVAVSGYGQDEDRRRSAQAGFDAHLIKPMDPAALRALLARAAAESARPPV